MQKLQKITINIGLPQPFSMLHLSDSHICRADARETQRKRDLAAKRIRVFDEGVPGQTEAFLQAQLAYAEAKKLPILYTGDFCDFVSYSNLEYMRQTLFSRECFMAIGNHEYSLYVGEAREDEAYKMQSYDLVQSYFPQDIRFDSRVIGGINFVAIDNIYYDFTARQKTLLQAEVEKGLPIVLMLHTPLYTPDLTDFVMRELGHPCAYVVGAPDSLVDAYPANRAEQQRTNVETAAFIEYVYSQPGIRAVLAGHLHENFETRLPSGIMQYVTGGGFRGYAREITFQ